MQVNDTAILEIRLPLKLIGTNVRFVCHRSDLE